MAQVRYKGPHAVFHTDAGRLVPGDVVEVSEERAAAFVADYPEWFELAGGAAGAGGESKGLDEPPRAKPFAGKKK